MKGHVVVFEPLCASPAGAEGLLARLDQRAGRTAIWFAAKVTRGKW